MNRTLRSMLLVLAVVAAPPVPATEQTARFAASAELRPLGRSVDGRFTASAEARVLPATTSVDGRFTLKATHAPAGGCAPFPDPIFANGFEP